MVDQETAQRYSDQYMGLHRLYDADRLAEVVDMAVVS
jgi:hypothetical protein